MKLPLCRSIREISPWPLAFLLMASLMRTAYAEPNANPQRQPLWPTGTLSKVAGGESISAFYSIHHPERPNGTAMIICPGGGYGGLVTGAEGHGIARWLNSRGITGVVLEYRLPKGNSSVALADAQRAIRWVRSHAAEWKLQPNRVGIIGFSAGGHLASTAGTHFDTGQPGATDPIERISCRPDFMILIYPVITMAEGAHLGSRRNLLGDHPSESEVQKFSNELQVTPQTPPAFLAHALNDTVVPPSHSANFFKALQAAGVPAKYLELPSGGHGLDKYQGPMWEAWQSQSLDWLRQTGLVNP